MSKKTKKNAVLDYVNAVKKADREREIAEHGKLISTRPTKIKKSKKVYNRQENKKIRSSECGTSDFFCLVSDVVWVYLSADIKHPLPYTCNFPWQS